MGAVRRAGLGLALLLATPGCRAQDVLLLLRDGGADGRAACYARDGASAGQGLVAWYPAEGPGGAAGDVLVDASGNGNDAMLMTGVGGKGGFSFGPGRIGNALQYNMGKEGYAVLPPTLLSHACEVTLAAWVYLNQMNAWMRIFDIGQSTKVYMFLTNNNNVDHVARFGITTEGSTKEENVEAPTPVPLYRWAHFAVTLGPAGGALYIDGAVVGTNPTITHRPSDLGVANKSYMGRSQFPTDPYLDANVDDMRIYDRALSSDEIAALANVP